jgi:N-acetylglucosaminyldiphosphoundecaprenol N-acetyl-beta-D-mannosaminyltransferase
MTRPAEVGRACADISTAELLGFPVVTGSREALLTALLARLASRRSTHVVTLNPEMVIASRRAAKVREVLQRGDVFVADGVGLTWAAGVLHISDIERYPGVDLAYDAMRAIAPQCGSAYLLGSKPGVAEQAAEALMRELPGLKIAGIHSGYYTPAEESALVANIAAAKPDLLLVGMGCPKQEEFISNNREQLNAPLMIGVGGSLDVYAGVKPRAPEMIRRCGMEWAYRSILDISRLKRLGVLPGFVMTVLREARGGTA